MYLYCPGIVAQKLSSIPNFLLHSLATFAKYKWLCPRTVAWHSRHTGSTLCLNCFATFVQQYCCTSALLNIQAKLHLMSHKLGVESPQSVQISFLLSMFLNLLKIQSAWSSNIHNSLGRREKSQSYNNLHSLIMLGKTINSLSCSCIDSHSSVLSKIENSSLSCSPSMLY